MDLKAMRVRLEAWKPGGYYFFLKMHARQQCCHKGREDDGNGIDTEAVKENKAIRRGIVTAERG